ncbi:Mitochondrial glycine transporter [Lamellibrachia satsuma]|nr:Mitochondrial glycine transporter [Lamellibrachia satsuma]
MACRMYNTTKTTATPEPSILPTIPPTTERCAKVMDTYKNSPLMKSFLAGAFSGTCSTILFQPLDLVKTRLQAPVALGERPAGLVNVFINVVRQEKPAALWKGLVPSLVRTVPGVGVYFTSLHALQRKFGSPDPSPLESLSMGMCARSMAGLCMLPFTVIKTRYESGQFSYRSVSQALVRIYHTEGTKGLFSGLSATLMRDAPFSGLYLTFYIQTKKMVKNSGLVSEPQRALVHFACGILAGCLAGMVTQPADVVKTHMQLYPDKFHHLHTTAVYIYRKEGWVGFLRGITPRIMRRTMMAAMAWTVYEQIMSSVGLVQNKKV